MLTCEVLGAAGPARGAPPLGGVCKDQGHAASGRQEARRHRGGREQGPGWHQTYTGRQRGGVGEMGMGIDGEA
jgi:hypothetical protein